MTVPPGPLTRAQHAQNTNPTQPNPPIHPPLCKTSTPVEYWGFHAEQLLTDTFGSGLTQNFTYKSIRSKSPATRGEKKYTTWCNREHELYDLSHDPFELDNIFRTNSNFVRMMADKGSEEDKKLLDGSEGPMPAPQLNYSVDAAFLKRVRDRLDAMISGFYNCKVG